ncbi:MAG: threonine ammonia-lyase [Gemmatimonadaceae bacterium]
MPPLPTPAEIRAAASRIEGVARRTPLRHSRSLSEIVRGDVHLKLETEQDTGSFKIRGAFNAIASLPADVRARGVVASSAGNHGLGVAVAAHHFGIPARIFVPRAAPEIKKRGIAGYGAEVDDGQPDYDAAMTAAKRHAAEQKLSFINPCLGDTLLAGQGTVALEIVEDLPSVASVVLPVGGAGLLGGCAGLLRAEAPHVRILGAQSVKTAAMARSLAAGQLVAIDSEPTLADGLAGQIDGEALEIGRRGLDGIVMLEETEIARAIAWLVGHEAIVAEGAGAVGVAAVLEQRYAELPAPIVIVVSGGNIDSTILKQIVS